MNDYSSDDFVSTLSIDTVDDDLDDVLIDTGSLSIGNLHFDDTITITDSSYGEFVINRPGKQPMHVAETLEKIMDRLAIIEPDLAKMEKYPALKEAYDNYKIIEGMLLNNDSND